MTIQGLKFHSCRSAKSWTFGQWESQNLALAMSTCHSLVKSDKKGVLIGNPVDRAMFKTSHSKLVKATGSTAVIRTKSRETVRVLRRFDFDHNRMTQSVIVEQGDGRLIAFCKGSGEKVASICESVPENFFTVLQEKSKGGIYCIAVASKPLEKGKNLAQLTRDEIEKDLVFDGILNFENPIRKNTGVSVTRGERHQSIVCIVQQSLNLSFCLHQGCHSTTQRS